MINTVKTLASDIKTGDRILYKNRDVFSVNAIENDGRALKIIFQDDDVLITMTFAACDFLDLLTDDQVEFIKDIDVTRLDIKSWLAVCDVSGTYRNVAVARWVENLNSTLRANITLPEWLEIAEIAGYKKGWALNKFEEYGS